jgi:hypothetical protein
VGRDCATFLFQDHPQYVPDEVYQAPLPDYALKVSD